MTSGINSSKQQEIGLATVANVEISRPPGLAEEVCRRIRADIMSLKIPPDTRISVDSLARRLGVSQTPIREALSMLEANGLVVKKQYSGYCAAARMGRHELDELFEFRLIVEPYAARKAAEAMSNADIRGLGGEIGNQSIPHEAFAETDTRFHKLIAEGAGNHIIADALARLHIHIHIFRACFRDEITKEAINEHNQIFSALKSHNGEQAEAAMRRHIEKSYARLSSFVGH